jgi:hypothetical protein
MQGGNPQVPCTATPPATPEARLEGAEKGGLAAVSTQSLYLQDSLYTAVAGVAICVEVLISGTYQT